MTKLVDIYDIPDIVEKIKAELNEYDLFGRQWYK